MQYSLAVCQYYTENYPMQILKEILALAESVNLKCRVKTQAVSCRLPTAVTLVRTQRQVMWDLWWTKRH
jgi:hypothetical protein